MRKGWYWPWIIVALLVATAAGQGVMLYAATHDPSMAIEPDYYRKAVDWDTHMAQDAANRALGWTAQGTVGGVEAGAAEVVVRLNDAAGASIGGARVRVTAIHNLDGARHVEGTLAERADGLYAARLRFDRPGMWEIRVDAVRGAEHFTASLRTEAALAPARPAGVLANPGAQ
jgi:nitrogen fixation protein FixH